MAGDDEMGEMRTANANTRHVEARRGALAGRGVWGGGAGRGGTSWGGDGGGGGGAERPPPPAAAALRASLRGATPP